MKGKVERNELKNTTQNNANVTNNGSESLVDSTIESIEGGRYPSIENDKQWEEFLTVTNEILVHYYQYLKESGEEI